MYIHCSVCCFFCFVSVLLHYFFYLCCFLFRHAFLDCSLCFFATFIFIVCKFLHFMYCVYDYNTVLH